VFGSLWSDVLISISGHCSPSTRVACTSTLSGIRIFDIDVPGYVFENFSGCCEGFVLFFLLTTLLLNT
jgi:hypothetical protein